MSVAVYRAQIHHLRLTLDSAAARPATSRAALPGAESRLRRLAMVRLPNGRTISTPTSSWAQELRAGTVGAVQDVAQQLDALDVALIRTPSATVSPAALRRLDAILRDPRFHHPQSLQDLIQQWLTNLLLNLLNALSATGQGNIVFDVIFAVLLLGMVAGLAYLLARRSLGRMVVEVTPRSAASEPVTATAATAEASRLLVAAGDYRTALRYLFLATLLELQDQKLLTLRPGMTNREYLRNLNLDAMPSPARPGAIKALADLTEQFDRVWYGHQPFGAAAYAHCEELARSVTVSNPREPAA